MVSPLDLSLLCPLELGPCPPFGAGKCPRVPPSSVSSGVIASLLGSFCLAPRGTVPLFWPENLCSSLEVLPREPLGGSPVGRSGHSPVLEGLYHSWLPWTQSVVPSLLVGTPPPGQWAQTRAGLTHGGGSRMWWPWQMAGPARGILSNCPAGLLMGTRCQALGGE